MALCSRCLAIPLQSLPPPRPWYTSGPAVGSWEIPYLCCEREIDEELEDQLGYPWHPDLGSLAASASSCILCQVVHKGFKHWLAKYKEAKAQWAFGKYSRASKFLVPEGQVLYLTQRFGGGPGFNILVERSDCWEDIYILPGVCFSVDENHPMAHVIQQRPIDVDSGSDYSLAIARSFLTRCRDEHETCRFLGSEALLPSRILDVGSPDGLIKLIEPRAQHGIYVCLSYCWGESQEFTTTQRTMGARLSGFHLHDLPKTLRDAVKVVRYLGIRFIWIDCLCICQDDREDWAREAARMADVYANAYLVLAAGHATGHSVGLFNIRTTRPSCRVDLPGYAQDVYVQSLNIRDEFKEDSLEFSGEPLSGRAWAFQERILGQRVLHFNSRQLYYECEAGVIGEDGCLQTGRFNSLARIRTPPKDAQQNDTVHPRLWSSLVSGYSSRKLTHVTDKLPAMAGLAELFGKTIQADYLAGVWSDRLIDDIAWSNFKHDKPQLRDQYIAPSWSWASCQGSVLLRNWGKRTNVAKVLDWKVDLKSEANPFGEVLNGYLRLRAPMVPLNSAEEIVNKTDLDEASELERCGLQMTRWVRTPYVGSGKKSYYKAALDYDEYLEPSIWNALEMKLMLLSNVEDDTPYTSDSQKYFYNGFIVIKAPGLDSGQMRRIGWLNINVSEAQQICQDQDNWHTVILV